MAAAMQNTDILIIGAGLAGLSAASELRKLGIEVFLVDKGRGLGGRLASRRIGDASFDHGAQFMTTRHPKFVEQVKQWIAAGVAKEWYSGFPGQASSHARYRGVPTMTAIAKHLAIGLNVQLSTKVESIGLSHGGWTTQLDNGESITSRSLLITSPVPQTLKLLADGNIQLSPDSVSRLARIQYESCIAVMAILDQPSIIEPPGALVIDQGPIAWISDNQQKGVSLIPAVTIHGSGEFSAKHFDDDRNQVARQLIEAATPYIGAAVIEYQVHGWLYSKPVIVDDSTFMLASESTDLPPLILAGDAFAGPRVEGAVLSGWAAADYIAQAQLAASMDE
jgi:renalase